MKRLAVFVATTAGPVRVERITRERAPQSMVCLKRSSTVLPISAAYDGFVRPGSGVIEKTFGPFEGGAFRLDVSAPIESGESWQLGFLLAHALSLGEGACLASEEEADEIVWLTGQVDCDLDVGAVGHVTEKVHASQAAFSAWLGAGRPVTLFLRDGPDFDAALAAGVPAEARAVPLRSAREMLTVLGLAPDAKIPGTRNLPALRPQAARTPAPWLAGGFAAIGLAVAALTQWPTAHTPMAQPLPAAPQAPVEKQAVAPAIAPQPEPQQASAEILKPVSLPLPLPEPKVSIVERRAPAGHTCAEVQFGAAPADEVAVSATEAEPSVSQLAGLCGLGVAVDNGDQSKYVAVTLDVVSGKLLYGTQRPDLFAGQTSFSGRHVWAIDLPRRLSGPFEIRVAAVSGEHPVTAAATGAPAVFLDHRVNP